MAITLTNLTSGVSTVSSASYGTASISPSANTLLLLAIASRRTTTPPSTVTGNGCTWVLEKQTTLGTSAVMTLWRTMSASPSAGAVTITFASSNNVQVVEWSIAQFDGVSTASTDGAGAVLNSCVASFTTVGGTTKTIVLPAITTGDGTYGFFAADGIVNPWTTGPSMTAISIVNGVQGGSTFDMITEWQATTLSSVAAIQPSVIGPKMAGIATELVAQVVTASTWNIASSISAPVVVTGTLRADPDLLASIAAPAIVTATLQVIKTHNLAAQISIPVVIQAAFGKVLASSISARATVTATLLITHQLQAAIVVAAAVTATLTRMQGRLRSTQVFDLQGHLEAHKGRKRIRRDFSNTSSPRVFQNLEVTTTPQSLLPPSNARWVLFTPEETNTDPFRVSAVSSESGLALSSVGASLISVGASLSGYTLVTTVAGSTFQLGVGWL